MKEDNFNLVFVVNTSTGPVDVCDNFDLAMKVREYFIAQGFGRVTILSFRVRYDDKDSSL